MFFKIIGLVALATVVLGTPIIVEEIEGRVVGGAAVTLGQVPFMASLRTITNLHFCGGAILSNRWVLTAAQCTDRRAINMINIVVGTVTLNAGGVTHRSANITQHPSYDPLTQLNDISLVYTATIITFTPNIQTIGLNANIIGGSVSAQMSGWGSNSQAGGVASNALLRMTTNTTTINDCRARHVEQNSRRISDNKICTFTRTAEGNCFGDEGGALIAAGQIIGISSWQVPCGTGLPDVYEGIASKRLWILSITN